MYSWHDPKITSRLDSSSSQLPSFLFLFPSAGFLFTLIVCTHTNTDTTLLLCLNIFCFSSFDFFFLSSRSITITIFFSFHHFFYTLFLLRHWFMLFFFFTFPFSSFGTLSPSRNGSHQHFHWPVAWGLFQSQKKSVSFNAFFWLSISFMYILPSISELFNSLTSTLSADGEVKCIFESYTQTLCVRIYLGLFFSSARDIRAGSVEFPCIPHQIHTNTRAHIHTRFGVIYTAILSANGTRILQIRRSPVTDG